MKTFPTLAFLASLATTLVLPVSIEVVGSLLVSAALIALATYDYGRSPALRYDRRHVVTAWVRFRATGRATEANRLAA